VGSQFAWFYDIFTVAIFCICIYVCGKRGFLRSVLMILGYIAALVISFLIADWTAPAIYDSVVKPVVIDYIEEKTGNIDPVEEIQNALNSKYGFLGVNFGRNRVMSFLSEDREETYKNISDYISEKGMVDVIGDNGNEIIGGFLSDELNSKLSHYIPVDFGAVDVNFDDDAVWSDVVRAIKGDGSSIAVFVEKHVIRGIIVSIVRMAVFILAFVILAVVVKALSKILKIVDHIPLVNSVNSLLGGVIGVIQGAMSVYVIALGVRLLISIGGNSMIFFNKTTIDMTYLFSFFYNLNIL